MKALIYKDDTIYRKGSWQLLTEDGSSINPYATTSGRPFSGFLTRSSAEKEAKDLGLTIVNKL